MIIRNFSLVTKAIIIKDGKLLLLRKSESEMKVTRINKHNRWDLPGGAVQFFEKSYEGLHREVREETNLNVSIIKPIGVYDAIKSHIHMTIVTYLCICNSGQVSLSYEHDECYWLTPEEVMKFDMPSWLKRYFEVAIEEYNNMKLLGKIKNDDNKVENKIENKLENKIENKDE